MLCLAGLSPRSLFPSCLVHIELLGSIAEGRVFTQQSMLTVTPAL